MVRLEDQMNNENLEMLQQIFEVCFFPVPVLHSFGTLPFSPEIRFKNIKISVSIIAGQLRKSNTKSEK